METLVRKTARKAAAPAPKAASTRTQDAFSPIWKTQHNRVQGAIWRHIQADNKVRFTISISRSYLDAKTKKWVTVHFFDEKDLRDVVAVANEAQDEIQHLDDLTTEPGED